MSNPEKINHFKIWEIKDGSKPEKEASYSLFDQFHKGKGNELEGTPIKIEWLANPVEKVKRTGKTRDIHKIRPSTAYLHLTGWKMEFKAPVRAPGKVQIRNQLTPKEGVEWTLGAPEYLLVPAAKNPLSKLDEDKFKESYTDKIDHYLCYTAQGDSVPCDLTLKDQIDVLYEPEPKGPQHVKGVRELISKLEPKFLGVPVQKQKNTEKDQPAPDLPDGNTHLAIYELFSPKPLPEKRELKPPKQYATKDQFATLTSSVWRSLYLAVPSTKEKKNG